jgi:phosphate acetyltransferase
MFQYNLVKARKHREHIVLPENDDRIITAAARLPMDVVDISIIGIKNKLKIKWQSWVLRFFESKNNQS